jgi:vancomycin permeability regulator SanA
MTKSGDTDRLPPPPTPSPTRPAAVPEVDACRVARGEAPWLTESAYAWPTANTHERSETSGRPGWRRWLRRVFFLVLILAPLSILAVGGAIYWNARAAEPHQADAIVVMGAAQYNGRPSQVFQARLDHALELYEQGYAPLIVVTGGKMPGDVYTEAETATQYLVDRGVPPDAILAENQGRDTWQSMQGVAAVLEGTDVGSLLIVSDGYHLLRSELMAGELGYQAWGSAAPDSPIRPWSGSELAYVIRETGGIIALVPTLLGQAWFPIHP